MDKYFTKSFFKFFFTFLVILAVAFGVLIFTAAQEPAPVDNLAQPQ